MLDTLRKQRPAFNEVNRAATATDRDRGLRRQIDGAEFEGGTGEACPSSSARTRS